MRLLSRIRAWLKGPAPEWRTREEYLAWRDAQAAGAQLASPGLQPRHRAGAWLALDFETANAQRSSACAIGCIQFYQGQEIASVCGLIRPPSLRFDPGNVAVHGIRARDVRESPTLADAWPSLEPLLEGATVVAHNAKFDLSALEASLAAYGIEPPRLRCFCTLEMAHRAWPQLPNHRLDTVA